MNYMESMRLPSVALGGLICSTDLDKGDSCSYSILDL